MKYLSLIFTSILLLLTGLTYSQEYPTTGEVYDYDIGDVFHIHESGSAPGSGYSATVNIEILDKYYSINGDTVFYLQLNKRVEAGSSNPNPTYTEIEETIFFTDLDEVILTDSILEDDEIYNGRITVFHFDSNNSDTFFEDRYTIGCGHSYHQYRSTDPENQVDFEVKLVYYKKGDEEWGNEHIVGVNEMQKEVLVSLSPNPAKNNLKVLFQDDFINSTINIFDINGQLIWSDITNSKTNDINVSSFQNGLYFIQQVDEDGFVVSKSKFLKI